MKAKNNVKQKQSAAQVKKYLELKQNKHNANIKEDVKVENYVKAEIYKIFESDVDKQDGIGYLQIKVTEGGHISFVATSDIHIKSAKATIVKMLIDYISNTNTFMLESGDILQMDKDGYQGGTQESRINSGEEIDLLKSILKPIAHKIIAAVGGNHDDPELATRLKDTFVKVLKQMYEELGVYYSSNAVILEWLLPVYSKNKALGEASFVQVLLHDSGKTKSKKLDSAKATLSQGMGIVDKFNRRMGTNLIPDMINGGHFHAAADLDHIYEADIINDKGLVTGTYLKTIRVRSNHTLQDSNSSSFNRQFGDRQIPTFTQTDIHFEYNDSFDLNGMNTKPEFVPVVTEFPILSQSGKLTTKSKEYMQARRDYTSDLYNTLKKETAKNEVQETLDMMNEEINLLKN